MKKSTVAEEVHYNPIQLDVSLVRAHTFIGVMPRGIGKTTVMSDRKRSNVEMMPGSLGAIVTPSYTKLLKDTLPALIHGLKKLGYREGVHFVRGRYHKHWPKPIFKPETTQHIMHFYNGTVAQFVSQDVSGSANGPSYDWMIADELKFIDRQKLGSEMFPAMRGNEQHFGHIGIHHGWIGMTDMPMQSDGSWIFEYEHMMDKELITAIRTLRIQQHQLMQRIHIKGGQKHSTLKRLYRELNRISKLIAVLNGGVDDLDEELYRPPAVHYVEPKGIDVLANLNALKPNYYRRMARELTELEFSMSILNERHAKIEHGFYPELDPAYHGYLDFNNSYMAGFNFEDIGSFDIGEDCRSDGDLNPYQPLKLAPDYGVNFNCCMVGQLGSTEFRFLKNFYGKKPEKIADIANKFCHYYRFMHNKTVELMYDSTAKAESAISDENYVGEWKNNLERHGWTVILVDCGRTPTYKDRYDLWSFVLTEEDPSLPKFRFNKNNCNEWVVSCEQAPVIVSAGKLKKDKSSERPEKDQLVATHLSEAGDVLFHHTYKALMTYRPGQVMSVIPK